MSEILRVPLSPYNAEVAEFFGMGVEPQKPRVEQVPYSPGGLGPTDSAFEQFMQLVGGMPWSAGPVSSGSDPAQHAISLSLGGLNAQMVPDENAGVGVNNTAAALSPSTSVAATSAVPHSRKRRGESLDGGQPQQSRRRLSR